MRYTTFVVLLLLIGSSLDTQGVQAQDFRALVFSKTSGFRHASIPAGIAAITELGAEHNFTVDATEDAAVFTDDGLAPYQVVIFLNTTGDVLNPTQQDAFERYIQGGGGFAGIHSAADTEYDWPFYGNLVGAYFESHPQIQQATIKVADPVHPSTRDLPRRWTRTDEWYNYRATPRGTVHVLATLDESTYSGGSMGHDHPIAWCHNYVGGRAWYTGSGHTSESYAEPLFRAHLLGGIRYVAGATTGNCDASVGSTFEKVILDDTTDDPVDLAVAPDGRVFFIEIGGTVKVYDPATSTTSIAGDLNVWEGNENGLIGIVLDPGFAANQWMYLFYTPNTVDSKQRVSRFTVDGHTLDMASERVLLEIPIDRSQCCHAAGSMAFDAEGHLFIATGDDTNPFDSNGYTPIDERSGRESWDAQRSSANTNDLRGKILRITPQPDGTYTIPDGNLFPNGTDGRPEIYTMGHRNPYRIAVDTETGWLYWGDVGPDAGSADPTRGPAGLDEWNQARAPGNYGWPYCIGPNRAYNDYNFAFSTPGPAFDCSAPVNDSPNNTGSPTLPPAQPAWLWYPYTPSPEFPAISQGNGGRTAMAGPVYHFDETLNSEIKLPAYYDGTVFIYEWSRGWIHEVKLDDNGNMLEINPFAPEIELLRPISMRLGPDGALYLLEWGTGFSGNNTDSKLVRIDYRGEGTSTGRSTEEPVPGSDGLVLEPAFPNPVTEHTTFSFSLPQAGSVKVEVFDLLGRRVAILLDATRTAGTHTIRFEPGTLASGTYLCRLTASGGSKVQEITVVK